MKRQRERVKRNSTLDNLWGNLKKTVIAPSKFYFYSLSEEFVHLSLQDVIIGIVTSECPLPNYFLLIAKLYIYGIAEDLKYLGA